MKKAVTLKENYEFRRMYQRGKSAAGRYTVVYCRKNRLDHNRFGFTVSTKLGGAVVRNRARRRLREVCRLSAPHTLQGYDLVVVARGKVLSAPFSVLLGHYEKACRELHLWRDEQ